MRANLVCIRPLVMTIAGLLNAFCVLVVSPCVAEEARPTEQATSPADTVASLRAKVELLTAQIVALRKENEALRRELAAMRPPAKGVPKDPDRDKAAAAPATEKKQYSSLEAIIKSMPKSTYPTKDQRRWMGIHLTQANAWFEKNVVGSQLQMRIRFNGASQWRKGGEVSGISVSGDYAVYKLDPNGSKELSVFDANGIEWQAQDVHAGFGADWADKISKLVGVPSSEWQRRGDTIVVSGTITRIEVKGESPWSVPRGVLSIGLADCSFTKSQ